MSFCFGVSSGYEWECTLSQTSIQKSQFSFVQKLVGISSKDGWERVSCMISSNMNKNKRLLYILFPLSSLIPLPLPLCSSKLDHPSPSSSSHWNSSVFLQFLSFFFLSSLNFYGLLLLKRCKSTKKTYIFGKRMKKSTFLSKYFFKNGRQWNFYFLL